ncbi:MAG: hypothetical protein ACR2JY_24545 [Chloroflexota bacterium]
MLHRNIGRVLGVMLLSITLAGCGGAGSFNAGTSATAVPSPAVAQTTNAVVATRTVVITSTIFVTATVGSGTASTSSTASTSTTAPTTASPTVTAVTSSVSTSSVATSTAHATPTAEPGSLPVADAGTVTLAFLAALEKDPSGATSLPYLSSRLQAMVRGGHPVASIVGIQNMYTRYHADTPISRGGGRAATVRVTLTFAAGPIDRLVTLIPEGGAWRIDDIADSSAG